MNHDICLPVGIDRVELCPEYRDLSGCEGESHSFQHEFFKPGEPHESTQRAHLREDEGDEEGGKDRDDEEDEGDEEGGDDEGGGDGGGEDRGDEEGGEDDGVDGDDDEEGGEDRGDRL